jgi:MoaA/NifB/PqqE/SkfB family radical SAM enzyme
MNQEIEEKDYASWGRDLYRSAFRDRRPIAGSISITHRCNLGCVHCFLQPCRDRAELSTEQWKSLVDEMEKAGCLWLVMTGGEPLLRPDFDAIYRHARERGFLINIFTNGTSIDDRALSLFSGRPPSVVEMSLYGFTSETYTKITGNPEARDRAYESARRLVAMGIPLRLKAMVLRQNASELEAMQRFSLDLGAPFRFDAQVSPCLDGSRGPCSSRLDDETILRLDVEDGERHDLLAGFLGPGRRQARNDLFTCNAGMTSFHIYPDGQMALCVNDVPVYDLKAGSFMDGWNGPVLERRMAGLPEGHPCKGCMDQAFCGVCPAVARMETGSDYGVPEHLCRLGRSRKKAVEAGS